MEYRKKSEERLSAFKNKDIEKMINLFRIKKFSKSDFLVINFYKEIFECLFLEIIILSIFKINFTQCNKF